MKICIICHNEFEDAPPEHVIPKSIGGQYTVHNVCKKCNHSMNKSIDEPFTKHKIIGTYRFALGVKGRGKKVSPPIKGESINLDGVDYIATLNEDLKLDARIRPEFPGINDLKVNEHFQVTLDGKDMHLLQPYLEKVANRLKIPVESIQIKDKKVVNRPESKAIFGDSNNKVILEYSKILYQTACDLYGNQYINDATAQKYAQMLYNGIIDNSIKKELNPEEEVTNQVFFQMLPNIANYQDSHVIVLSGYAELGLIGLVKIFNEFHVQVLSRNPKLSKLGMYAVINNFEQKTLSIHKPSKLPNCRLNLFNDGKTDFTLLVKELGDNPNQGDCPLYLSNGQIFSENLFELVEDFRFFRSIRTDFKTELNTKVLFRNQLFIKSEFLNRLFPVDSIDYRFTITTLKQRK